ncbi:MAG: RES family NAD+ phosphorylase [Gemmatimonadetes bacterium]|nr:RES family NAD+ phosphorylase [Gemmatimonadota bacterium]
MPCWRVFPWKRGAADGAPFSARYIPPAGTQTGGRFDLGTPSVLYLAQSPAHALAELLQGHRGKAITSEHLVRSDPNLPGTYYPLSLVRAALPEEIEDRIADLANPSVLLTLDVRPDQLASHDREVTRAISRRMHAAAARYAGFRWWSALTGEWHVTVLFLDRADVASIDYTVPEPLDISHPAISEAARFLGISLTPA